MAHPTLDPMIGRLDMSDSKTATFSSRVLVFYQIAKRHWTISLFIVVAAVLAMTVNVLEIFTKMAELNDEYLAETPDDTTSNSHGEGGQVPVAASRTPTSVVVCEFAQSSVVVGSEKGRFSQIEARVKQDATNLCQVTFESFLVDNGHVIVDRLHLPRIVEELRFQRRSGLVDPSLALKIGRLTPAQVIILVELQARIHAGRYDGYGVTTFPVEGTLQIDLRLMEVETGEIRTESSSAKVKQTFVELQAHDLSRMVEDAFMEAMSSIARSATLSGSRNK